MIPQGREANKHLKSQRTRVPAKTMPLPGTALVSEKSLSSRGGELLVFIMYTWIITRYNKFLEIIIFVNYRKKWIKRKYHSRQKRGCALDEKA
jgi:hypothetical protein